MILKQLTVVSTHAQFVLAGSVPHHACDMCLNGGLLSWLMHGGYFWKGVGLKRRGESDGEDEGDSDSRLQHLREDGENDVCCRWFCTVGWGPGGIFTQVCNLTGPPGTPHHTIYNEEVQHRPQDCSEWVRPVNGETYPVRKANECSPNKREHVVSMATAFKKKWNTKKSAYSFKKKCQKKIKVQQLEICKQKNYDKIGTI